MSRAKEFDKWYEENQTRFHQGQFSDREIALSAWYEVNHETIEDVKGLIDEFIPKITDECYNVEDGFKHYGIDCKLGREKLITELEKQKI